MKIVEFETYPVSIPYKGVIERSARVNRGGVTNVVIKLVTDDGFVGWGEGCSGADTSSIEAALKAMRPFVLGRSPWELEAIANSIYSKGLWDYRIPTANFAFGGIDMALWDLCGKASNLPIHRFFGGIVNEKIGYFVYLLGETESVRIQCQEALDRNYRCFYLKVGVDPVKEEEQVKMVREMIGPDKKLRIDSNEAWSIPEAIKYLNRWHEAYDLDFAEAPIPVAPLSQMQDLRKRVSVALCANEGLQTQHDALAAINSGAFDVLCFSSHWVGGLRKFWMLSHVAALHGQRVCKHTHGEFGIAAAAHQQVLLTLPNVTDGCQTTAAVLEDDILQQRLPIVDGPDWGIPDGPGLGVDVDIDKLERYADLYSRNGQFLPYAA